MTSRRKKSLILLIAFVILSITESRASNQIVYKTSLIGCSEKGDSTIIQLRKLLPKGFYIITELGAKDALKAKIDADVFKEKFQIADKQIDALSDSLISVSNSRSTFVNENSILKKDLKSSKRRLFFSNLLNYGEAATIIYLIIKLL